MNEVSRRVFLKGGSAAVVAAGAISAIPGLPALVGVAETQGPADVGAAESAVTEAEASSSMSEPLIAHIRDLGSGEIGLFSGTREITVLNPQLAASLFRAMR
ncbi:MAG: twin-arginine translocation signal domain-containing protein [Acidimicrobiales bacterium]|jgi:hypothetical protein